MDSFFGIGLPELFFIAVLALVILGPERLPGTLREIAKAWGYIRNLGRELTSQFSEEFKALEDLNPRKLLDEIADEELKKDLKSLTQKPGAASTAKPATSKPATPKPAATTTKPASTTTKATTNTSTTKSVAKPKPVEKPAAESAVDGALEASGNSENSILPPPAVASEPSSEPVNEPTPAASPAPSDSRAEQPPDVETPLASSAAVSVNGAGVNGASDPGENVG
jgi:sec-independent protein translocase protein TatB